MKALVPSLPKWIAAVSILTLAALPSFAAPPGESPLSEVEQAYDGLETYQSDVDIAIEQRRGRWTMVQKGTAHVAYDREGNRLRIDHPSFELAATDKLRMKTDQLPGTHLEVDAAQPLAYASLQQHVQPLLEPALPDVAMLLSDQPQEVLGEGVDAPVVPRSGEGEGQQYEFTTSTGTYTLTVDPASKLITRAVHEMDPQKVGAQPGDAARVTFTFRNVTTNEPLPEDAFALDTSGSRAADSLQAMMTAGAGPMGGGEHPLVGQAAPAIELATADGEEFKLSEADERVIVLDFWATWCPPCRRGLPLIQNVHDWAEEGDRSVAVYAVNVGETVEQVEQYWQQNDLSMPVLMDTQMQVGAAYGAEAIPHTVVIADGKVRHVHTGFTPGLDEELKTEIEALLAEPAEDVN